MGKKKWYSLLICCILILTFSFIYKSMVLALIAFTLGMYLKKYSHTIAIPKEYQKYMGIEEEISVEELRARYKNKSKR